MVPEAREAVVKAAVRSGVDREALVTALTTIGLAAPDETGNLETTLDNVFAKAIATGLFEDLILALVNVAPLSRQLLAITTALVVRSPAIEAVARLEAEYSTDGFAEPFGFADELVRHARRICVVEAGTSSGTGFLVGPARVLTAHHVVPTSLRATCRFDYSERSTVEHRIGGRIVAPKVPLDFALIELDIDIGRERIAGAERGWIDLQQVRAPRRSQRVVVLQHPRGETGQQRLRMHVGVVTEVSEETFVHNAGTRRGSSGSPVLAIDFAPLGVHVAAGNVAVSLTAIDRAIEAPSAVQSQSHRSTPREERMSHAALDNLDALDLLLLAKELLRVAAEASPTSPASIPMTWGEIELNVRRDLARESALRQDLDHEIRMVETYRDNVKFYEEQVQMPWGTSHPGYRALLNVNVVDLKSRIKLLLKTVKRLCQ